MECMKQPCQTLDLGKTYLITGCAGFIGYFLAKSLLESGCQVVGIDNLNSYYDVDLKYTRLEQLNHFETFTFMKGDVADLSLMRKIFHRYRPQIVAHLAAQAGVRYSVENPEAYIQSNIEGFFCILEACKNYPVEHLVYASSSSVYGKNEKAPFSEGDAVEHPVSLYAATKKSNELMAYSYSHLYKIPATGLRFFTVYGPLGRPDMAYFCFANQYFAGKPIKIFNNGDLKNDLYRDFTYIDDIVEAIERLFSQAPSLSDAGVPHRIFNIGNNKPEKLMTFIETLEKCLSKAVGRQIIFEKEFEPLKPGDVPITYACIDLLHQAVGFRPKTSIEDGLQKFADWYCAYYKR